MKKLALLFAAVLVVAGCAAEKALEKPTDEVVPRVETPLWRLITFYTTEHRENPLWYQDEWFVYKVELEYIKSGTRYQSAIFSSCPVARATETVWDRETEEFIREETVRQITCASCHKR